MENTAKISVNIADQRVFESLFSTHYEPLCRYATKIIGDKDDAEEVVQQVFYKLWEKRQERAIQTAVHSYLFRAVKNACLNQQQHEKVKREYVAYTATYNNEIAVEDNLEIKELEQKIALAIQRLPEGCREIFEMSRNENLSYKEIAEKRGISIKTVENQMGKALKLLREELKEYSLPILLFFLFDMGVKIYLS